MESASRASSRVDPLGAGDETAPIERRIVDAARPTLWY
jgi:hypothetical protein